MGGDVPLTTGGSHLQSLKVYAKASKVCNCKLCAWEEQETVVHRSVSQGRCNSNITSTLGYPKSLQERPVSLFHIDGVQQSSKCLRNIRQAKFCGSDIHGVNVDEFKLKLHFGVHISK